MTHDSNGDPNGPFILEVPYKMNHVKPKKAKQKSLIHFHLAQGGRNFEEVHDISSLKLANLLSTMENLESLQLSSLLSTYDQGWDKFTVN